MRTYAGEYGEISKKQFSRATSRGLQWENKILVKCTQHFQKFPPFYKKREKN